MPNYHPHRATNGAVPNNIKKGMVRNPRGSSEKSRRLGKIKRLTLDELQEVVTLLLRGKRSDFAAMKEQDDTSILRFWVMSLVAKSIQKGDVETFDLLMSRIIGKAPEHPVTREFVTMEEEGQRNGSF